MSDIIIYISDSRNMSYTEDECVDFIISGPPLWNHLFYSRDEGQIGSIGDYNEYLKNLKKVWRECNRVLKKGRFMAVIVHDFYIKSDDIPEEMVPLHIDIFRSCLESGFRAYDMKILDIYPKTIRKFLPKDERITSQRKDFIPPRLRYLLIFRKGGNSPEKEIIDKLIKDYWQPIWSLHDPPKVLGSKAAYIVLKKIYDLDMVQRLMSRYLVERIRKGLINSKYKEYPAVDSIKIYKRAISTYTKEGETILDPFIGSGTAALAAAELGRNCIGYEINRMAVKVIKQKLESYDPEIVVDGEDEYG